MIEKLEIEKLNRKKKPRRSFPISRRVAFALLAALLIGLLCSIPTVRVWAADAWGYVVRVFAGRIEVERESDPGITVYDPLSEEEMAKELEEITAAREAAGETPDESQEEYPPVYYDSVAAFTAETGREPYTLDAEGFAATEVYSVNYPEELLLVAIYTNGDGAFCNLIQGWSGESQSIVGDDKNAVWRKQSLKKGQTLYYFTNEERNSLDGVVIAADYTLMVYTEYTTDARWVARALQVP